MYKKLLVGLILLSYGSAWASNQLEHTLNYIHGKKAELKALNIPKEPNDTLVPMVTREAEGIVRLRICYGTILRESSELLVNHNYDEHDEAKKIMSDIKSYLITNESNIILSMATDLQIGEHAFVYNISLNDEQEL